MKTLHELVTAKQYQAVQATIDALLASGLLGNDSKAAGVVHYGEHLSGRLGSGTAGRRELVGFVMRALSKEPMALPHTPNALPLHVLLGAPNQSSERKS